MSIAGIKTITGKSRPTIKKWIMRFAQFIKISLNKMWTIKDLIDQIIITLSDAPRSGTRTKFDAIMVCRIMAIAVRNPEDFNRTISHWSLTELTSEIIIQGITTSIDRSTVGRILKEADIRPHKIKYWLTPKVENEEEHLNRIKKVCKTYNEVAKCPNTIVYSTDEKTGIQALEFINKAKPMKPGSPVKIEFEYKRHGTLCLIPSFNVAAGTIDTYTISETRDESDFADHIRNTLEFSKNSGKDIVWVMDQLNTHKSETLVRLIAEYCQITEPLGEKGKEGVLKSMNSRQKFLENESHKVRLVFTPKHCSWLNQVEIWFGVISRKLLKRLSVSSKEELKSKIEEFIAYFNGHLAKPYRWTYEGKALKK